MQPSTYDRALRLLRNVLIIAVIYILLRRLSAVLVPFFLAWLVAYLLYPIVCFFQYRLRLHYRVLSVAVTLLLIVAIVVGACWLLIPLVAAEFAGLRHTLYDYLASVASDPGLTQTLSTYVSEHLDLRALTEGFTLSDLSAVVQKALSVVMRVVSTSLSALISLVASLFAVVYLFFILCDYEHMASSALRLVPPAHRRLAITLFQDVKQQMQAYFRGQALIAFLVGIGFAIGFSLVGYPLAIPLGLFIGVLNLVPYLQVVGILPTVLLAGLRAYQTGENFWYVLLLAAIVFICVQSIQDWILIPRIMGKVTGYNGAIIFLALSVWGSLLGLVGMIIALPLTSVLVSYYKRYVLREDPPPR